MDLTSIKQIPILTVARRLGIEVRHKKAMCFSGHDAASPSLAFSPEKNLWKCFGACGKGGDAIRLVMEKEGLDFTSAVEWFCQHFRVSIPLPFSHNQRRRRQQIYKRSTVQPARAITETEFSPDPEIYNSLLNSCTPIRSPFGLKYLADHAISTQIADRFLLRELNSPLQTLTRLLTEWGSERVQRSGVLTNSTARPPNLIWRAGSIMIPFQNAGKITYLQARTRDPIRKFVNVRGRAPMFNSDRLTTMPNGATIHLCEGVPDALALETYGLPAVGILGAHAFRTEWVDVLLRFDVVVLGDGDAAGKRFTRQISKEFAARAKATRIFELPAGKDVADVLNGALRK